MAGSGSWQYGLIWTPGKEFSTCMLVAHRSDGTRVTWDTWTSSGFPERPTAKQVYDQLWQRALEVLERHSDQG